MTKEILAGLKSLIQAFFAAHKGATAASGEEASTSDTTALINSIISEVVAEIEAVAQSKSEE